MIAVNLIRWWETLFSSYLSKLWSCNLCTCCYPRFYLCDFAVLLLIYWLIHNPNNISFIVMIYRMRSAYRPQVMALFDEVIASYSYEIWALRRTFELPNCVLE